MTIVDHWNIGNRLQNYAVQEALRNIGVKPETIKKETTLYGYLKYLVMRYRIKKRPAFGIPFDRKFIKFSKYGLESHIPPDSYDYFVVGSDQVWNPNEWYNKHKKDKFLLSFIPEKKRVAFSASFGINKLPDEWKPWFQEQLSQFKCISVREDAGKKIVEKLTDHSATVLIDPTCLFDKEKWDTISTPPKRINLGQPYILTYFLGGRSDSANRTIQECAEKRGLAVYHLADPSEKELLTVGPSEFLYLVSHAEVIFTDSFHGGGYFLFFTKSPFWYTPERAPTQAQA